MLDRLPLFVDSLYAEFGDAGRACCGNWVRAAWSPGQGVKLLHWTQLACRVQLAFANHVHDLDSRQGYRG
jgi:hypothetical protein